MSTLKVDTLQTLDGTVTVAVSSLSSGTGVAVEDNLTSTSILNALSANQGRALNVAKANTVHVHTKADVGLGNVDNTSDAAKPVSIDQQTALNTKQATLVSGTNIKTINGTSVLGVGDVVIAGSAVALNDLTDVAITTPVSGQTINYNGAEWVNSTPAIGVTDHGLLTGLADDDHTQYLTDARGDARYQGQLDTKAPLASPALTGAPTAPTAAVGTNTTQVATTAFAVANGPTWVFVQATDPGAVGAGKIWVTP